MEWVGREEKKRGPSWTIVVFLVALLVGVIYGLGLDGQVVQAQSQPSIQRGDLMDVQQRQADALEKIADELKRIRVELRKHGGKR